MSIHRRKIVQIINPVPGGAQYTTDKAALQLVQRGRAVWEANQTALRFIDQVQAPMGGTGGAGEELFRWRRGISGGMAQIVGSAVPSRAAAGTFSSGVPAGEQKEGRGLGLGALSNGDRLTQIPIRAGQSRSAAKLSYPRARLRHADQSRHWPRRQWRTKENP
jgi:hypothetical protein